jgi:hypothetical protein
MELARFKKVMPQPYWFYLKAVFLMIGGLGALAALYTGNMAKFAVRQGNFTVAITNFSQVVRMHENFADLSVAIFGLLAAAYLIAWINKEFVSLRGVDKAKQSFSVDKIFEFPFWSNIPILCSPAL